jgi:hypothetical protein
MAGDLPSPKTQNNLPSFSRRQALYGGALGAAGMLWSNWLSASSLPLIENRRRAKSVILIFNCGAPSHIDLWDMKPHAPDNIRGTFQPIPTNVSGIQISELLPELAKRTDKLAIVRTVHHEHSGHNSGMYWSIVGKPYRVDSTLINPSRTDLPSFGTLVSWFAQQDGFTGVVPPYVIAPAPHCDSTKYITPGQFGGCLGAQYDPFVLNADPNAKEFEVPSLKLSPGVDRERVMERSSLLKTLEIHGVQLPIAASSEIDVQRRKALALISSDDANRAFDLSREPEKVRERYGRHRWGQSHLLARRLIEAGSKFVTTVNGQSIVWDTHQDNFNQLKNRLVPPMEQAYTALLDDLSERGLLDETLVVWMGDFGRTPIINKDAGRDHWPQCYSVVLAGGGVRGGQVVGESDSKGAYPKERPVTPADIHATVFAALGYDFRTTYQTSDGRPMPASDGDPITELL